MKFCDGFRVHFAPVGGVTDESFTNRLEKKLSAASSHIQLSSYQQAETRNTHLQIPAKVAILRFETVAGISQDFDPLSSLKL